MSDQKSLTIEELKRAYDDLANRKYTYDGIYMSPKIKKQWKELMSDQKSADERNGYERGYKQAKHDLEHTSKALSEIINQRDQKYAEDVHKLEQALAVAEKELTDIKDHSTKPFMCEKWMNYVNGVASEALEKIKAIKEAK